MVFQNEAMKISLSQVSKRYHQHWIFKNITYTFESPNIYAILGANGSGKSTLMRIIASIQGINSGTIQYENNGKIIVPEKVFEQISYCAPGLDIIEEMTLKEFLDFHFSFKKIIKNHSIDSIINEIGLSNSKHKILSEYSSGMKQRVKLAQAFFADTPILLLDEPCSNLDQQGVLQYQELLQNYAPNRLTIIASNEEREYSQAKHHIPVEQFQM